MTMAYLPGQKWQGTVDYVYPELDTKTRSLRVRLTFDNHDARLKPNMYSRIKINTGSFTALSIPSEALIRTGEQERVVKALGGGKFRSVLVKTGRKVGSWVEVLRGLSENDRVVTSAQFLLDSESSIAADLSRFEEPVSNTVWIEGVLKKNRGSSVSITHEPVPEWSWPTMTMDFDLNPKVDMSKFNQGQSIRFEVKKTTSGGYQILAMKKRDTMPVEVTDSSMGNGGMGHHGSDMSDMSDMSGMSGMQMNHKTMSKASGASQSQAPTSNTVWMEGVLKKNRGSSVNITHEPVPEWGWPTMTMTFDLSPKVDISNFNRGQFIRFKVKKTITGGYQILAVKKLDRMPAGASDLPMGHGSMDNSDSGMSEMNHDKMGH